MMKSFKFLILGVACANMMSCASMNGSEGNTYNLVVKEPIPLNESGPAQTVPAATSLSPGDRVRIINTVGNHVYVETIDGHRGFIPKNALEDQGER
ncbi:MAG: SH3 domain-containing protein [Verrucomicrobiota bacterium]